MSITGIKKRVACFYDDKGEFLGKRGFSKTAKLVEFGDGIFNVYHEGVTVTRIKRWYWDVELYHYNYTNPNPLNLKKRVEPIIDSEMYNIQLKTKVARDLNDLSNEQWYKKINIKMLLILLAIGVVGYFFLTGQIHIFGANK